MAEFPINPIAGGLMGVPVGTILAYMGPLNSLPPEWQPCDGRTINDSTSPFHNRQLPNLMNENRFLMGVPASAQVNVPGGNNVIPPDGQHSHGGATNGFRGYQIGEVNYNRVQGQPGDPFMQRFGIDTDGQHAHGGDNRPAFLGTYFIIRIR